jgi:glucose-1-phosphate cytidylyltransferase
MRYYAHFGHKEFILCLGYRGDLIKEFFLQYNECLSNDFTLSHGHRHVDGDGGDISDWTIHFVETGLRSNLGQRLLAVREYLEGETMFIANYSDGLTDVDHDAYVRRFEQSGAVGSFLAVRPSNSLSGVDIGENGQVYGINYLSRSIFINGGFMVFRSEIFDYIRPGEELVEAPFSRLIDSGKLWAMRYGGFWIAMDTFKDKRNIDAMYERDQRPWEIWQPRERWCQ